MRHVFYHGRKVRLLSLRDKQAQAQAKIRIRLKRLEAGNFGDCEAVGEGVHELREHLGAGYRVHFGRHDTFARNTRAQLKQVFDAIRELMTPPEPTKKRPIGFISGEEKPKKDG